MRTEKNKDGTRKVWITRKEFNKLYEEPQSANKRIVIGLMGIVGLRVGEVLNVCYDDIRRSSDGKDFILEVDNAKDVSGEYDGGKQRDVFLSSKLERQIFKYIHKNNIDESDPIVGVNSKRTIQNWISNIGDLLAKKTDDKNWKYLSCHDLRRSLVSYLIHNNGVQISIVKNQMGWSDISTVKNYLDDPNEKVINREFEDVDF